MYSIHMHNEILELSSSETCNRFSSYKKFRPLQYYFGDYDDSLVISNLLRRYY